MLVGCLNTKYISTSSSHCYHHKHLIICSVHALFLDLLLLTFPLKNFITSSCSWDTVLSGLCAFVTCIWKTFVCQDRVTLTDSCCVYSNFVLLSCFTVYTQNTHYRKLINRLFCSHLPLFDHCVAQQFPPRETC